MKNQGEFTERKVRVLPTNDHMYAGVQTEEFVIEEKPWKRVFNEVGRKGTHLYEPVKSIPSALLIILLGVYLLQCYFAMLINNAVTTPVKDADLSNTDTTTFNEESAWRHVNRILGTGPRVAGTQYHLEQTAVVKALVDEVARNASLPVFTDWQFVSGDYFLEFDPPLVNCYQNASNIIAVLEGESGFYSNGSTATSLLVNCHYDSVPYALGTSDNTLFCGVMMETLSKLSRRQTKLKHNVVFLFNGAEENSMQASHGFLKHSWISGCTNVINLDAAGMNGKPNVFQLTDPRLLSLYKKSTGKPQAQSFGEYLFTSGVIPSDTDFRVFRDFGDIRGIDIAFVKQGHVYHTRYDSPALVEAGVLQAAGDMLLRFVELVAGSDVLEEKIDADTLVYYDYLSWFLVMYTFTAAHVLDTFYLMCGVASILYYIWLVGFHRSTLLELSYSFLSRLLAAAAGTLVVWILIPIMVNTTGQLRYLTQSWIIIPVFCLPYAFTTIAVSQYFDAWRSKKNGYNRSIRTLQAQAATRVILCLALFVFLLIPTTVTMRYLVSITVMTVALASAVEITLIRVIRMDAWQHLIMTVSLTTPAVLFLLYIGVKSNALILPLMGRNHSLTPDYTVATLNMGFTAFVMCVVSGTELLFSRKRLWMVLSTMSLVCIVIMFIPMSPYSDDGPSVQRHYWFHSEIITHNYEGTVTERISGVFVSQHDTYTTSTVLPALHDAHINLNYRTDFTQQCQTHVYCNLPLYRTRFGKHLDKGLFLYTSPPVFEVAPTLVMLNRTCSGDACSLYFNMTGTPHNLINLYPRSQVNITSWTFDSPVLPSIVFQGRNQYDIVHSVATYSDPLPSLVFGINMTVAASLQSQPIIDVAYHAHRIFHPEHYTAEYRNLVDSMPKYFNIASFLSVRHNYIF